MQKLELTPVCNFTSSLSEIIRQKKEESLNNKSTFDLFSCLTKLHREELHTKVIRYLLNPMESHLCGSSFLKLFLDILTEDNRFSKDKSLLDINDNDLNHASVEIKDKYSEEFGRMDIFIETRKLIIVIENKVRAQEGHRQIERYVTYCEKRCKEEKKNFIVFFLTPDGRDSEQAGDKNYYTISYSTHIHRWLKRCIDTFEKYSVVRVWLKSYLNVMEKNVLNLSTNDITMDLIDILLEEKNKEIIKYLPDLYSVLVPLRNRLRADFFNKVFKLLNDNGYNFIAIERITNAVDHKVIWDQMYRGFKITTPEFKINICKETTLNFCVEHNWENLYYGLVAINGVLPIAVDFTKNQKLEKIYEKLNKMLVFELQPMDNCWLAFKNFTIDKSENFADDNLNFLFANDMEKIANKFVEEIKSYLKALKQVADELKQDEIANK